MSDAEKLNTTCKRLQLQCFRNYVLCNAVDEKLNDLDNGQQKINDEIDKLNTKLNDIANEQCELINKMNNLDIEQRDLVLKYTNQIRIINNHVGNVYTAITMISIIRLTCIALIMWWFLQK